MLDHIAIQCQDVERAAAFYDAVLAPLGGRRVMSYGPVVGYGVEFPSFWIGPLEEDVGQRPDHIAFQARSREEVQAFFDVAVGLGAQVLHEPRVWPEYHPGYFGAFVRDPDGNNVEAVHHTWGA